MIGDASGAKTQFVSVVVPTYNRPDRLIRLLSDLRQQTLSPSQFEVVVSDDGSNPAVAPQLRHLDLPYALTIVAGANAGAAAARHAGVERARGDLLVFVDDDMLVPPGFLAAHVAAHRGAARRVVMGQLYADPSRPVTLFECWRLRVIHRKAADVKRGRRIPGGTMYTGNVSLRRSDYYAAGGFDPQFRISEDLELGIRLEERGAEFTISRKAWSYHAPSDDRAATWCRRAVAYGISEMRIGRKLEQVAAASPWRYLPRINLLSRCVLSAGFVAPALTERLARALTIVALNRYHGGRRAQALKLIAAAYALLYYVGVRREAGSWSNARRSWRRYLSTCDGSSLRVAMRWSKLWGDLAVDRDAVVHARLIAAPRAHRALLLDVGRYQELQCLGAYRLMRFFRDVGLVFAAKAMCRVIRHAYAVHLHWDADIAPGVVLKGNGIVAASGVRVAAGSVLSERVTLDACADDDGTPGVPSVQRDVVIGAGAALLGGISVGAGAFIAPRSVLTSSVPAGFDVDVPLPGLRPRAGKAARRIAGPGALLLFSELLS